LADTSEMIRMPESAGERVSLRLKPVLQGRRSLESGNIVRRRREQRELLGRRNRNYATLGRGLLLEGRRALWMGGSMRREPLAKQAFVAGQQAGGRLRKLLYDPARHAYGS